MHTDLVPLRAGPLALWFQPDDGRLRHICARGQELVRGIVALVRDQHWGTVANRLQNVRVDRGADDFRISFDSVCVAPGIDYQWRGEYSGNATGEILLRFAGRANAEFSSNRIGFCVLHPAEAAGCAVEIGHIDGRRTKSALPTRIAPHQPARGIRSLTLEHGSGLVSSVEFSGEVFEMEDQRNWLDASFKTYCRPLELPYPVRLRPGDCVEQTVRFFLHDAHTVPWIDPGSPPCPSVPSPTDAPCPAIGLAWPCDDTRALSADERVALRGLRLNHLRVDIDPADDRAMLAAHVGLAEAEAAGLPVEIALYLDNSTSAAVERWVRVCTARIARWIVIERGRSALTDSRLPSAVRQWRGGRSCEPVVGGGHDEFTALNRNPPPRNVLDGVSFGCSPQVHAFDERSIRETLLIIPQVVEDARIIGAGAPVHVSVLTFHPAGRTTDGEDPRLATAFGAAWTRDAFSAFTAAGAASVTCYTVRGVLAAPELARVFCERRAAA